MRMHHIVICADPADPTIFFTVSCECHDFRVGEGGGGNLTERKMGFAIFATSFSETNFHSKKKWEIYDHKCKLVFL